jgi:hypothetical protein
MSYEIVKDILWARRRVAMAYPYAHNSDRLPYFGDSELSDILSFGFSFIEHEDHCAEYLLVSVNTMKRIVKEIEAFNFTVYTGFIGVLWTSQVILTDKIGDDRILFANKDYSVVLDLNITKSI